MNRLWLRLRNIVVHRILGVDDTPHRIAWGVLLGFVVAWTPTIGFQIMIYLAVASLLRANKIAGIPILFISNPFTAVPLYYFAWRVGAVVLHGWSVDEAVGEAHVRRRLLIDTGGRDWASAVFSHEFWSGLGRALVEMGGELWLGSLILGVLCGVPAYFVTRWAVQAYRRGRRR